MILWTSSKQKYTRTLRDIAERVGHNYTNMADVWQAILKMEIPTFPTPTAPPEGAMLGFSAS